jgi:hypothetical protein
MSDCLVGSFIFIRDSDTRGGHVPAPAATDGVAPARPELLTMPGVTQPL